MVSTAFHGALEHADLAFVSWGTLRACVVRYLDGLRGWWVGRQTNAQLKDNDCRSKEPTGWRVHEMWIQFHGRTNAHGSKEPIKLNIHSSHKSGILSPGRGPLGSLLSFSRSPQGENKAVKGALILESLRQDFRRQRSAATTESSSQSTPGRIGLTRELWRSPRRRHHQWAQWLWHFRVIGRVAPELVFSPYIKQTWNAQLNRLTVNQLLRGCVSISILEYGALIGKDQHIQ